MMCASLLQFSMSTFCEARPRKQLIKSVPPSADITQQKFRSPHGPRRAFRRFEEKLSFENPYTDLEIQISQSRPADKNAISNASRLHRIFDVRPPYQAIPCERETHDHDDTAAEELIICSDYRRASGSLMNDDDDNCVSGTRTIKQLIIICEIAATIAAVRMLPHKFAHNYGTRLWRERGSGLLSSLHEHEVARKMLAWSFSVCLSDDRRKKKRHGSAAERTRRECSEECVTRWVRAPENSIRNGAFRHSSSDGTTDLNREFPINDLGHPSRAKVNKQPVPEDLSKHLGRGAERARLSSQTDPFGERIDGVKGVVRCQECRSTTVAVATSGRMRYRNLGQWKREAAHPKKNAVLQRVARWSHQHPRSC
ncbi:hypothetical protein GEV33_006568 [Tenebrio molitor]|uniref:Uncharacterized protein n=1 Tax=Tenebrio molitor TaxID=7067 RepID=A0A8J6HL08_TENMO|nr:hypothetical protein GEV33_006568 [Tenebrio molitor]